MKGNGSNITKSEVSTQNADPNGITKRRMERGAQAKTYPFHFYFKKDLTKRLNLCPQSASI
jgi:DNA mismatch repair protein MutH